MVRDISIGVLLQIAGRIMQTELERVSADVDLTSGQLSLLGMVCRFPDLPQSDYSKILIINEATLGRYASRLEETGNILRTRNDPDGRIQRLTPTESGQDLFALLGQRLQNFAQAYSRSAPAGNVDALHEQLVTFLEAQGWALPDHPQQKGRLSPIAWRS